LLLCHSVGTQLARSWHALARKRLIPLARIGVISHYMSLIYKGSSGLAKVGVPSSSLVSRSKFNNLRTSKRTFDPP
jgi:hypothetical protein